MASERMLFENVDRRTMDPWVYYKLTYDYELKLLVYLSSAKFWASL